MTTHLLLVNGGRGGRGGRAPTWFVPASGERGALFVDLYFAPAASSGTVYNDSLTESVNLTATQTANQTFAAVLNETVALAGLETPAAIYYVAIGASVAVADDYTSTHLTGGTTYNDSISESILLGASFVAVQTFTAALSESVALNDTRSAQAVFSSPLTESIATSSGFTAQSIFNTSVQEFVSLDDAQQAAQVFANSLGESVALVYVVDGSVAGLVWPDPSTVQAGVTYGPTGTEYTGTAVSGVVFVRRR